MTLTNAASIIWRDDDVGRLTRLDVLEAVDDVFQRYGVRHTIAIIAHELEENPDVIALIKERRMVCQLHCWNHDDLTVDKFARDELAKAFDKIARLFGPPTVLFPPWNKTSPELEEAAAALGLAVSTRKVSLAQFLRVRGAIDEGVVNFHHWHVPDATLLERALAIATGKAVA